MNIILLLCTHILLIRKHNYVLDISMSDSGSDIPYLSYSFLATPTHPLPTSNLKASKFPSKAAQSVGVIPSSSFALQSFLVASLSASRYPSRAALETAGLRRPMWGGAILTCGTCPPCSDWERGLISMQAILHRDKDYTVIQASGFTWFFLVLMSLVTLHCSLIFSLVSCTAR